ncbi:unnamed protein product [Adineta steineri]|uniref:Uncharacterized protein n=1 Tax=Adineta steineri TaxID=433720 RepID=A0A814JYA4_9BILA|nr:unnamed protein product [Adineta steineri]CAF1081015.1 unnamed protein product [Adineta steineri]CAF3587304.1 unnamed protein product [Adineta steineri]CAF4067803.1 unnamed protein product [Adineta steineri]
MVVIINPDAPATKPLAQLKDPQLQRSRKILLIMLGICLTFWFIMVLIDIVFYTGDPRRYTRILVAIVLIAFNGFGLFVSYKYSKIGLRVVCNLV